MKKILLLLLVVSVVATSLCVAVACGTKTEENRIVEVKADVSTFVTKYTVGDPLNIENAILHVTYSDGTLIPVKVTEAMIDKASFSTATPAAKKTMKITYQNFVCNVYYQVVEKQVEHTVKNAYLENMPTEFFKNDDIPVQNGLIPNALLCLDIGEENPIKLPVKRIWVYDFSSKNAGTFTAQVKYESDYGPVSVNWEYKINNLASVKTVQISEPVAVYQYQEDSAIKEQLKDKTFVVTYSDDSTKEYTYDSLFKISNFSSEQIGESSCYITFTDNEGRNVKFNLKYTVKQNYDVFKVTFDFNHDGEYIIVNTIDGKVTPPLAQRDGYEESAWYLWNDPTLSSEPFNFESVINQDIILRPRWRRAQYTIKIYSFGVLLREESYNIDTERPLDKPTAVDGYVFSHFEDEQGRVINNIVKGMTGNLILNSIWNPVGYKITYDLADSTSIFKAQNTNPDTFDKETPCEFVAATRNGYNFEGWYYNGEQITTTEGIAKDIKVVAKWSIAEYSLNLVNTITEQVVKTEKFKITDSDTKVDNLVADGYEFLGWFEDQDFQNEFTLNSNHQYYIPSGSFGDKTLYAKLERVYQIVLDARNNSSTTILKFKQSDEIIDFPIPSKFGADFNVWVGQGDFSAFTFAPNEQKITVDVTEIKQIMDQKQIAFAQFIASYTYHKWNITYHWYTDLDNQEILSYDTYFTNIGIEELKVIERTGFVFGGWYRSLAFSGMPYDSIPQNTFDEDLHLYAKWTAISYSIKVDMVIEGANVGYIPATYTAEDSFMLPIPTHANYVFVDWYLDSAYTTSISVNIAKGTTGDINLFAKWEAIKIDMVLLNMVNATYDGETTYSLDQEIVTLQGATKNGYTFNGWYLDSSLNIKVEYFETAKYPTSKAFTAYASWTPIQYNINYVLNDNNTTPAKNSDQNPTTATINDDFMLEEPTRVGYTFDGWFVDTSIGEMQITKLSSIDQDTTLKARWTERIFNITYENCDDVDISKLKTTFTVTRPLTLDQTIKKEHYIFGGWFIGETEITRVGAATTPELCDDLVLTAKWAAKEYTLTFTVNSKRANLTYTILDFENESYTLPTPNDLIEQNKLDESSMYARDFVGWYKGSANTVFYTEIALSDLAAMSFTAKVELTNYSITYVLPENATNPNSTNTFTVQSQTSPTTLTFLNPSLQGKEFYGWFADEQFTQPQGSVSGGKTTVKATAVNLTMYARFVDIYSITYLPVSGVTIPTTLPTTYSIAKANNLVKLSTSTYKFGGWWWREGAKIVTDTADFGDYGNVSLLPLVYDKTATQDLIFKLNEANGTAIVMGISSNQQTLNLPKVVSGYNVTTVNDSAFLGNAYIKTINIHEDIQTLGVRAFANCSNLETLNIFGATTINNECFMECVKLKTVSIAPTATIGESIFAKCTAIQTLTTGTQKIIYTYFGTTPTADSTVCGRYYVPNSLTTVYVECNSSSLNSVVASLYVLQNLYIQADTCVDFTTSDRTALETTQATVHVGAAMLEEYTTKYPNISFVA